MTNLTAAATEPRTSPPTGQPTPITDPAQIHDAFMAATNAHDVDALLALYDTSGVAVELDGSQASGAEGMRAMFVRLTGAIAHIDGTTRKLFVAGDVALSSASWTAQIMLPDGTQIEQTGTTAEVSRRQADGTWRMVIDDPMFC
jgi:uncharacterized protein (TIGR02246 family)